MFYNIAESSEEGKSGTIRDVLLNVLQSELKMPKEIILSLQIKQIHRVGQKGTRYTRPIVAKFSTFEEKLKVVKFIRNLDRSKKISIQDQLPPELNERKKKLWPMFKEARSSGKKVRWLGEKLTIDNKVVEAPKDFVRPLQADMIENISKTRLGQLGANISPDRSSLTPQVLIGNFLKHNYPLLYELQHINLLCLYLPKEDGVSPDAEYITQIIFSIFLQ